MNKIKIGNQTISDVDKPLYFIADIGANHDGDLNRAYKLIELAKEAGADAAKFQNFIASKIVSKKGFEEMNTKLSHQANWKKSVYEVYEDASLSREWTSLIKNKCDEVGIEYFTSPYDFESVDAVDNYVNVYKIGSGDITWSEILHYISNKGKPILIATGASNLSDIERAMSILNDYNNPVVLMQCNTNYTANKENFKYVNLNVLKYYSQKFPQNVLGLSDHTLGHETVLGSIALGARFIEKHFTDDNHRDGPDHKFAMNPKTWRDMVDASNNLFFALGDGVKRVEENEKQTVVAQRRALRFANDLKKGEIVRHEDLVAVRPRHAEGFDPYEILNVLGKRLMKDVYRDDLVSTSNIIL